jgi:hypothetical protein
LLKVEITNETAYMTGGASRVFDGVVKVEELYEV